MVQCNLPAILKLAIAIKLVAGIVSRHVSRTEVMVLEAMMSCMVKRIEILRTPVVLWSQS